jgi:hypothetical protein
MMEKTQSEGQGTGTPAPDSPSTAQPRKPAKRDSLIALAMIGIAAIGVGSRVVAGPTKEPKAATTASAEAPLKSSGLDNIHVEEVAVPDLYPNEQSNNPEKAAAQYASVDVTLPPAAFYGGQTADAARIAGEQVTASTAPVAPVAMTEPSTPAQDPYEQLAHESGGATLGAAVSGVPVAAANNDPAIAEPAAQHEEAAAAEVAVPPVATAPAILPAARAHSATRRAAPMLMQPTVRVAAVMQPSGCPTCRPAALLANESGTSTVADGDSWQGYSVSISGDLVTLSGSSGRWSYLPEH